MKSRIIALLVCLLALASPAHAKRIASVAITTAVTAQVTPPQQVARQVPMAASIQIRLAYGSGGATVAAWVQTSLDGGNTWMDIASQAFTTANLTAAFNVSSLTPVVAQSIVITDGSLASAHAIDGAVGPLWRVKYTTTGTYVGTTLLVDINGTAFTTSP